MIVNVKICIYGNFSIPRIYFSFQGMKVKGDARTQVTVFFFYKLNKQR